MLPVKDSKQKHHCLQPEIFDTTPNGDHPEQDEQA